MQVESPGLSRRERERQARREAMLAAASQAFAEKGYAEATLEEIADLAEFGKGTLYNYFPGGKQEILLAIFGQLYEQLRELIERSFQNGRSESFEERLESFYLHCFTFFIERLNLFMVLIREAHRLGFSEESGARSFFIDQRNRTHEALAAPIRSAMDRGELRQMSADLLAHMILTNVKGCQMQFCFETECGGKMPAADAGAMAETLTTLTMHGAAAGTGSTALRTTDISSAKTADAHS